MQTSKTASYQDLEKDLRREIKGEVCFDAGSRALYATDASNYRQVPIGVVIPENLQDIEKAVSICRQYSVPILTRGAGTSLAGQCCNVAVVIDMKKNFSHVLEIDPDKKIARVQPGVVLDDLRKQAKKFGLTFGPDPATHSRCTLGGMIGNNACGVHSITSGKTVDNVEELEILTYNGLRMRVGKTSDEEFKKILQGGGQRAEIYSHLKVLSEKYAGLIRTKFPRLPRRVSGYNLDDLLPENGFHVARALVGTEGTCVTVLEATVKLIPYFPARVLLALGYSDLYAAGDDVVNVLHYKPYGLEGMDNFFVANMKKSGLHLEDIAMLPEADSFLLVEFAAEKPEQAEASARKLMEDFRHRAHPPVMRLFTSPEQQKRIWSVRESSFGATVFVPGQKDTFSGFEDSAVPPEKLGDYMRDLRKLYDKYDYYAVTYGHFGDGCIHTRISFDLKTEKGIEKYSAFQEEAADLVVGYGGSLSGEHGDGQTWGHLLHKMFGPELVQAFRDFKSIWDPNNKMNPGKVVDAYRSDENLRLKNYSVITQPKLHFKFVEEKGDFSRTTQRCIGIGKCIQTDTGTMCPSYMVTGEEKHSTRGRAHLLFEMMRGDVVKGGWKDEQVKEALDLCLACKGCKSECPVKVDMSTYKAEFLSHYYEGRRRPLSAYAFGLISRWAHLASFVPSIANSLMRFPGVEHTVKKVIGIAQQRKLPSFASTSFKEWFRKRGRHNLRKPEVLLWPDTFHNYFYPNVAMAATETLEALGYQVIVPQANICCGRPLYDYGMLDMAQKWLWNTIRVLKQPIFRGVPIIGLEPSCVAVFRDELPHLFPENEQAQKLSRQVFSLGEFLSKEKSIRFPSLKKKAIVQGHCHQKSIMGMGTDNQILSKLGMDFEVLDSGCCGMAGAFGFEKEHYDISIKVGERVLLPAVRGCSQDTLIIANGFSCREQIKQTTGREALHLAEVLHMALRQ